MLSKILIKHIGEITRAAAESDREQNESVEVSKKRTLRRQLFAGLMGW
jgi:hypothetical protein